MEADSGHHFQPSPLPLNDERLPRSFLLARDNRTKAAVWRSRKRRKKSSLLVRTSTLGTLPLKPAKQSERSCGLQCVPGAASK